MRAIVQAIERAGPYRTDRADGDLPVRPPGGTGAQDTGRDPEPEGQGQGHVHRV